MSTTARNSRVYVAGAGMMPVTRKQNATLDGYGGAAVKVALSQADVDPASVEALYVGNMMAGMLSCQQHIGPLVANAAGLDNAEATTAEACCGAGGAALRFGYMAVAGGFVETAVVCGVEIMTHADRDTITKALATASHWRTEGGKGETFVSLNGALMQAYMDRYGVPHDDFAPFALTAHANAQTSAHAVFKNKPLDFATYANADVIAGPVQLFDASPTCDGAAAVVLTSNASVARRNDGQLLELLSSAAAIGRSGSVNGMTLVHHAFLTHPIAAGTLLLDRLPIAEREDVLHLRAVEKSAKQAISRAGLRHEDIDIFEAHDAYTVMACLSYENAGFVRPGEGIAFAQDGHISLHGRLPMATFGGLKARGHPVGATGVYQAAEMVAQLRGTAGDNQVPRAELALLQNIGGAGASVYAHVMGRV